MSLSWATTFWIVIHSLAAYRLTRLITHDSLPPVKRMREYVLDRWGDNPWSELADCPWCMGFWVSVGVTILASTPADTVWRWVAVPLAMSAIIGLIANRDG